MPAGVASNILTPASSHPQVPDVQAQAGVGRQRPLSARAFYLALYLAIYQGTTCAGFMLMNGGLGGSVRLGESDGKALTPTEIAWHLAPAGEVPPL